MIQLVMVQVIVLSALVYLLWLMPSVTRPTVPFGVRVPPDHVHAAVVGEQRTRYRRRILTGGGGLVVLTTVALIFTGQPLILPVTAFATVALGLVSYYPAHLAIAAAKLREQWYAGRRQGITVDTSLRTDPPRFPWPWLLPTVLILIATTVFGVLRYPALPATLAVHFGANGNPDRFAAKSVASVFALVFVQVLLTVLITGLARFILRARPELDVDDPAASAHQHRRWVMGVARALLVLLALLNLSMSVVSLVSWQGIDPAGWLLAAILVPVLLGGALVVAATIRGHSHGHQQDTSHDDDRNAVIERDDDKYWRGGLIYLNRDDPAVWLPKRFGIGWTLNFANPRSWLIFGALIAIAALSLAWPK